MRKITVTEALNELKLYDSKISKAITSATFCGAAKKSVPTIGVQTKDDFRTNAQAKYQSVKDLIANRNELKSAIVASNAATEITVNGVVMTRAEGIERKNSIQYEKNLLNKMKLDYVAAMRLVESENKKVDAKIDEMLQAWVGKDSSKKIAKEDQEALSKPYREANEFEFIDPLGIYEKMTALEADIDGFESNIDSTLVLSNATTFIELSF